MSDAGSSQPHAPRVGLLLPLLVPVGALVFIGLVLFGFSRVLLAITPDAATVVAIVSSASVLGIAAFIATRRRVSERSMVSLVGAVAGVAMVAGGVAILAFPLAKEGGEGVTVQLAAPVDAAAKGFATTSLTAPAGKPFTLAFDNQDAGVSHNVEIFDGTDATGRMLFSGDLVTGVAVFDYQIDPLDPGSYFFHCKIHPTTMTGTLEAVEGGGGGGGGGPTTAIAAQNIKFDTDTIRLAADAPTTITFDNKDAGLEHNLAIYTDDTATDALFTGDGVVGPDSVPYHIPALKPGTYFFHCDFHPPTMNGTVIVEPAGPPPPGASASASGAPTGGSPSASP
jgi:plastocyanin